MEGMEAQMDISHHHKKLPIPGMGRIYLSSQTMVSHRNPQVTLAIFRAIGCSTQTDNKALLQHLQDS